MNAALLLSAALVFQGTQSPFVGTWKLNPSQSHFSGTTVTYEQLPSGAMRSTENGQSYEFKTDGQAYPAVFGDTVTWKAVSASSWEVTHQRNTPLGADAIVVSSDGKTMTVNSTGTLPDGSSFNDTTAFERVSGGPGLAGKWKSTKVTISSPTVMEFSPYQGDGITWTIAAIHGSVSMKFDGKDNPVEAPTAPANLTLAATAAGPRSFVLVEKIGDQVVYRGTYTLSADGRTLTAVGGAEGTGETTTAVYDRQ
jgi:hypothetical protein